jgi:hypothetical protein
MTIGITDLIAGIFKPAADLVDELHTSEEEKLQAKAHMLDVQAAAMDRVFDYEKSTLEARAKIVNSEAQSEHWLTANWRPLVMITFTGLVVGRYLGFEAPNMTPEDHENLWLLIQLGLGGYVVGRSGEKMLKTYKQS